MTSDGSAAPKTITIDVPAPDGWICEVEQRDGAFLPRRWRPAPADTSADGASRMSPGIVEHGFPTPKEAMLAAFRERMNRDYLRRNTRS